MKNTRLLQNRHIECLFSKLAFPNLISIFSYALLIYEQSAHSVLN